MNQSPQHGQDLALIALGSNLGDRERWLAEAVTLIEQHIGPVISLSSFYETQPIGNATELFLNGALICKTSKKPLEILRHLLGIEEELGRQRIAAKGNRNIDLDLLLVNQNAESLTWDCPELTLPHPEMLHRDFVMIPAVEIAGEWIHPISKRSLQDSNPPQTLAPHLDALP